MTALGVDSCIRERANPKSPARLGAFTTAAHRARPWGRLQMTVPWHTQLTDEEHHEHCECRDNCEDDGGRMTTPTLAVTGSTGRLGGRVARRLASAGVRQRLVVRNPAGAPRLTGTEIAAAEYGDSDASRQALAGVQTLFMVSGAETPERRPATPHVRRRGGRGRRRARRLHLVLRRGRRRHLHPRPRPLGHRGAHPGQRTAVDLPAGQPLPGLPSATWSATTA